MKSIYASKLYRSSSRQDSIRAAIENPVNAELVMQIADYLDDEYEYLAESRPDLSNKFSALDDSADSSEGNDDSGRGANGSPSLGSAPSGPRPSLSSKFDDLMDDSEGDEGDEGLQEFDESQPESDNDVDIDDGLEPVDESTSISGTDDDYDASSQVNSLDTEDIRNILEQGDDSDLVNRILIKNNELWVYYNDDINLNTIMGPAIETLNEEGYDYLEFNRLARSDNAMVFQIADKLSKEVSDEFGPELKY